MQKWERLNELVQEQEMLKKEYRKESMLPIGGAATKMGSGPFASRKEKKDMESAYDKLQNMREQEIENNAVKIKELRKEVYKDTKDYGPSDEDKKLARDDKFRQMTLKDIGMNKGGSVKAKLKPAIAVMIGVGPAKKMAKGGKVPAAISEYGGKEKYPSKAAMMKHEKKESVKTEKKEGMMAKGGSVKKKPMKGIINKFV
jgi:hypothetical protein